MNKTTIILRSLLMMLVLAVSTSVLAQQISESEAEEIAMSFLTRQQQSKPKKAAADDNALDLVYTEPSAEDSKTANLYVFRRKTGGFAIIAGDARANSLVLGYSDTNDFSAEQMPENVKYWLGEYARQIDFLKNREPEVNAKARSKKMAVLKSADGDTDGEWLMETEWGQSNKYGYKDENDSRLYFNNFTPVVGGQHCVTGCVSTAMAQILYYHAMTDDTPYKPSYSGTFSYVWNNTTLTAPSSTGVYDWEKMALSFTDYQAYYENQSISNTPASTEIARLMYDCGVSVKMTYGVSGSSSYSSDVPSALQEHFGYSRFMQYTHKSNYSTQQDWDAVMKNEIDNKRPVLYGANDANGGGGHAFIMDGYKGTIGTDFKYHINWGWSGMCNGFYASSALNPQTTNKNYAYNNAPDAIINIYPDVDDGWSDWERIGKFGYTYNAVNQYLSGRSTEEGNVTVYQRTTGDGLRTEMKITDWGNGIFSNSDEIGDMFISIDRTKKIDGSNNKYLATIQPFNTKQKYTYNNVQYEMYLRDKVSGGIPDDKDPKYSYYDDDTDILYLNLFMFFGSSHYTSSDQDQLNLAWTAWEPFAPAGSNEGTYKYNTYYNKLTTNNNVFVRTKLGSPNKKQIQVQDWGNNINSSHSYSLYIDWDTITNKCIVPKTETTYSGIYIDDEWNTIYFENKSSNTSFYNSETGTFTIYGGWYYGESNTFNSTPGYDILQMSGTFRTLSEDPYTDGTDQDNVCVTYKRDITSDWGTLVVPFDFDPTQVSGFDFYELESGSSTVLRFQKIEGNKITAHTPLIFKRTKGDLTKLAFTRQNTTLKGAAVDSKDKGSWQTIGTYSPIAIVPNGTINGTHTNANIDYTIYDNSSDLYYVFSGGGVKHTTGTIRLKPFRALFKDTTGNAAKELKVSFFDGEDITSIGSVSEDEQSVPERNKQKARINLAGQHVGKGYRGFVIENGKKMLYR